MANKSLEDLALAYIIFHLQVEDLGIEMFHPQ